MAGIGACSAVLDLPDRVLDVSDGSTPAEGSTSGDVGSSGSTQDSSVVPDGGPPLASFSTSAIDFGLVACGSTATKDVAITNVGGAPLTWTATLTPTPDFMISGPSGGTIAVGAIGKLTIASALVPVTSGAGDTAQAEVTVTTDDPQKASTPFAIKRTAAGGTLTVVPLTADFGEVFATGVAATPIPIALKNVGNQAVTVGITAPGAPFGISWTGSPAAVSLAPAASMPLLVATFSTTTANTFNATAPIVVTGTLCGASPSVITLTGKGTSSPISAQPGSLDFGLVNCGAAAASQTVKILNSDTVSHTFTPVVTTASYVLTPASGSLGNTIPDKNTMGSCGLGCTTVTVQPIAIPQTSAITPNLYGDTLTITTNAPLDDPHVVDLRMTAQGAILSQSTQSIGFGAVLVSGPPATSTFTVTNSGNASATVSYAVGDPVFSVLPQNQTVAGGGTYTATSSFDPTSGATYNTTAAMSVVSTVLCAPLPTAIALSGQGALSASVTPSDVQFGLVNCGSTGTKKSVVFKNTGAQNFTWSASLGKSYYTLSKISGNLPSNQSQTIEITPLGIPNISSTAADFYADTLTITTNPVLESPYIAALHMTAQGVVLSFSPTSIDFGGTGGNKPNTTHTKSFSVVNSGNVQASITLSLSGSNTYVVSPTSGTVNGGANLTETATWNIPAGAASGTVYDASVSLSTNSITCAPTPNGGGATGLTITGKVF